MKTKNIMIWVFVVIATTFIWGCKKYLDEKSVKSLTTISKIKDLQALLYNDNNVIRYTPTTTMAVDEYYLAPTVYTAIQEIERGVYTWDKENYFDAWRQGYVTVYYSNVVLQSLENVTDGSESEKNDIRGQALFQRAFAFYELAQVYSKPYSNTAENDPGIALRLIPDLDVPSKRATVAQTYVQITGDLKNAADLLFPAQQAISRPFKATADGLLARTYLSMRDYENAFKHANSYLEQMPVLLDFNDLDSNANPVFKRVNPEVAYAAYAGIGDLISRQPPVDSVLYSSYKSNDLRKPVYFLKKADGTRTFKGSYSSLTGYQPFYGIATDEIYLIRSECYARKGDAINAMKDLNALLIKRWKKNLFVPLIANTPAEALQLVLQERRKELVYRGTRWTDLRRFNLDGANITLKRNINGTTYELPANDKRWVWLLPLNVIQLSGMQQNER